jgi:serine/threonine protein kinase
MHNLSSCFLIEQENKGEKIIDNITYYSFSLFFKSNSKIRKFFASDILIYTSFISNIKKSIGFRNFSEFYEIKEIIGEGRNSSVNMGIKKDTGECVTIKTIKKNEDTKKEEELVHYEIEILKFCQHKNIVQLIDYFETLEEIIIVLKYIKGNTLGNFLKEKNFNLNEMEVANIIYQIAQGLEYLQKFGIVHRDIKPDNIMISKKEKDSNIIIKIMDFGFSRIVSKEEKLMEGFGTLYYAAPELIQNLPYNLEIDIWSLGVIIYYIFTGCYPFSGKTEDEIEENILEENVEFKDGEWETISDKVKDLIQKCLEKNPEERINIKQFIDHPWFQILNKKKNG